ncbi:hypothetical protein [Agrococcus carbonis]|uniref:Uncharacterized protein n=1 Tax=Agrococcus carbonis TaxID=684552 RepID=A0A1H1PXZ2_9MICO|nr:hypothetical protein [Agrococcus carbonis]SDS16082.1 hypothetical protein SAMN04489719_1679 [Agrococcus carbonis]
MPELANGKYVSQSDAVRQWWPVAREVLLEAAREYGAFVTYDELSARIQASIGITTRQPAEEWIGYVLGKVAADAEQRREPRLTSLCVTAEHGIAEDYAGVEPGTDERTRERVAAEDRLACYRAFGAELPEDGGSATIPPRVLERLQSAPRARASSGSSRTRTATSRSTTPRASTPRASTARATPAPGGMREVTCPHCFFVVPAAATCRDCGGALPA